MSSLVRLGPGKSGGPLGITSHGIDHTILTPTMRSLRFKVGAVERVGGQHDGEIIGTEVPANARVVISPPTELNPRRFWYSHVEDCKIHRCLRLVRRGCDIR